MPDINKIQTTSYSIACKGEAIDVRFVFAELPNDMKMLSFLAGELSNSATFFPLLQMLIIDPLLLKVQQHSAIRPRIRENPGNIRSGSKLQQTVNQKNVSEKTKRSNITSFIAKQSRQQEFIPLVGEMIDQAYVEPLLLKNNAYALAHPYLLKLGIRNSNLNSITSLGEVVR
jgi:hypothetical protein